VGVQFPAGVDIRTLPVRFVSDDVDEVAEIRLRRDPSSTGSTTFAITPSGDRMSAIVIVYNEDRSAVIQAGALDGDVVASIEAESTATPSIDFAAVPSAAIDTGARHAATVVTAGDRAAMTNEHGLPAAVGGVLAEVERLVGALQSAAEEMVLFQGNDVGPFERAMRGAAKAGVRLRSRLGLETLDGAERIQVVSLTGETVLPLELVYDGPAPTDTATLCPTWRKSLRAGRCRACERRSDRSDVICPLRFWGVRKVIEHHQGTTLSGNQFATRVLMASDAVAITRPTAALVAVSEQVTTALSESGGDVAALDVVVADARRFGRAELVADWTAWTAAVAAQGPTLLVAMPHQGTVDDSGPMVPGLEIGGVFETTFDEHFLRREGETPGPVLLLLGCNTATEARALSSFASWFRRWSPVVVATIGEVIAVEAPEVASALLTRLDQAWRRRRGTTVGEALRDVRRDLLGGAHLVGLQLVLHGEAAWSVSRRDR
jgi:hypothetical protein